LDKDQGISRTQMEELAQDIDRWYRKNGAVMDATSRYWVKRSSPSGSLLAGETG
jgi:hypothetical protein